MYLPDRLPLPWRVIGALERLRLLWPAGRAAPPGGRVPDSGGITLAAIGDVFLPELPAAGARVAFDGLAGALARADLACCNLEAPLADEPATASPLGGGIRSDPGIVAALEAGGIRVANVAGNHALDAGAAGFRQTLARLDAAGILACGVAAPGDGSQLLLREAQGVRIGFLGYCDDHAPLPPGDDAPGPARAVPEIVLASVAAAAAAVDALVVQLHWGYEFRFHPLRRHRDLARELVDRGARLVLCHHAHVPMGLERRGSGLIAYGLGNALFPMTPYVREGHRWTDRSVLLEVRLSRQRVEGVRLVPFALDDDGLPRLLRGLRARQVLRAVAVASARLDDEAFMEASECAQLAFEGAVLLRALTAARSRDAVTLAARACTLQLPRQRALLDWLGARPGTTEMAAALRRLASAAEAGGDIVRVYDGGTAEFAAGLEELKRTWQFWPAFATRLP
jgi:poly-gamma-glutamate synthesis protein (capsule biosynthesis protein)